MRKVATRWGFWTYLVICLEGTSGKFAQCLAISGGIYFEKNGVPIRSERFRKPTAFLIQTM